MSCINLLANDVWSDADIVAHGREMIASVVPVARQDELRTILLGHIAGMRAATPEELAEIALVQSTTEAQALENDQARADMALLLEVLALEAGTAPMESASAQALDLYAVRNPVPPDEATDGL